MSRIRLVIDHVALQGLDASQRHAVVEALRRDLQRGLAGAAVAEWKSHRRPVLRLGDVALARGPEGGRALGAHIARAVARSLRP